MPEIIAGGSDIFARFSGVS